MSESPFLQACRGQVPPIPPVWLMRQAGRILEPYRALRERHGSIAELFNNPELAAQITLMPVDLLGVDAAILFTDLVTPLAPLGCPFEYRPGPVFARPVRSRADIEALRRVDPATDLGFVLEAIGRVRRHLPSQVALIGYGGAPFTLATWLVEGSTSKDFSAFRRLLYSDPESAHLLLDKLTDLVIDFLSAQIGAGAQAVQLFDTSAGVLSPEAFRTFGLPYLRRITRALEKTGVPRIYFALAAAHLLPLLGEVGADVIGVDWRIDLCSAYQTLGPQAVLQGNLDPCVLFSPPQIIAREAQRLLSSTGGRAHIFNLGHGVLPDTPCEHVRFFVDALHEGAAR